MPGVISLNIGDPIQYTEYKKIGINGLLDLVDKKLKYLSGE